MRTEDVTPVTHAVTNARKRITIIVAGSIILRNPMTVPATSGSLWVVFGTATHGILGDV